MTAQREPKLLTEIHTVMSRLHVLFFARIAWRLAAVIVWLSIVAPSLRRFLCSSRVPWKLRNCSYELSVTKLIRHEGSATLRQAGKMERYRTFATIIANGGNPPEQENQKETKTPDRGGDKNEQAPQQAK
jgi:hypothetical protein